MARRGGWVWPVLVMLAVVLYSVWTIRWSNQLDEDDAAWRADPTNPVNICKVEGGIPITSAWDGRLKHCEFAP